MEPLLFNGVALINVPIINRPSYMLQNNYGNEVYIPILEPCGIVTAKQLAEPHFKSMADQYKTAEEVKRAFFAKYPETTEGKLKDSKEVMFMGFNYIYHPKHTTYSGAISRNYILQPLLARWYIAKYGKLNQTMKATNPDTMPRKYNGGTGKGISFDDFSNTEDSPFVKKPVEEKVKDSWGIVPFIPSGIGRAAIEFRISKFYFEELDKVVDELEKNGNVLWAMTEEQGKVVPYVIKGENVFITCLMNSTKYKCKDGVTLTPFIRGETIDVYRVNGCQTVEEARKSFTV